MSKMDDEDDITVKVKNLKWFMSYAWYYIDGSDSKELEDELERRIEAVGMKGESFG